MMRNHTRMLFIGKCEIEVHSLMIHEIRHETSLAYM